MGLNPRSFIHSTLLLVPIIGLILAVSITNAQTISSASEQEEVAKVVNSSASNSASSNVPVFTDYRGVRIGMSAEEVRSTLKDLKKDTGQDFFVFSKQETAQIYYDNDGKVMAISIDYLDGNSNAPSAEAVLGAGLQPRSDGSMYHLKRYPEAGYWVSYNRTTGDKPIITITMQKMRQH
jgi:hypothetical protein